MILKVLIKPNKREVSVSKKDDFYVVKLKSKPVKGKANQELLQVLKDYFGRRVKIISGFASRKKLVKLL